jgi:hypothetical protein
MKNTCMKKKPWAINVSQNSVWKILPQDSLWARKKRYFVPVKIRDILSNMLLKIHY